MKKVIGLIELKQYLQHVRFTSLAALCQTFALDADFLRQMLRHWEQKGCIKKTARTEACGVQCTTCPVATTEIYHWVLRPDQARVEIA